MSTIGDIVKSLRDVVLLNDKVERLGAGSVKLADKFEAQEKQVAELRHELHAAIKEFERAMARAEARIAALEGSLTDSQKDRQAMKERLIQIEAQWQLVMKMGPNQRLATHDRGDALPPPG